MFALTRGNSLKIFRLKGEFSNLFVVFVCVCVASKFECFSCTIKLYYKIFEKTRPSARQEDYFRDLQ